VPQRSADDRARRRRRRAREAVALVAALACSGLLYLFLGPAAAPDPPSDLASLPFVDGTLTVVETDRLVLRPFEPPGGGDGEIEFAIRAADSRYFDVAHMQSHSSVALPTRIYFERSAGRYVARFKEDAPANSGA
jgi:hypothetical protein